ncbi:MAG: SurA N-terminal domain-containing protein [Pseudomonadota bacterium]
MLNLLRRGVKTWVAKVLFGLLVVSFAIWGIGDVFGSSLGSSVATIGDQKISAERYANAVNREVRAQSQRFGTPLDMETARAFGIDQQVLAQMAQEAVLDQAMADLNVSAPDNAVQDLIVNDPSFQNQTGSFDGETYRYLLAQNGMNPEQYEELTRRSLARSELARALSDGGAAPGGVLDAIYGYQTETLTIDYVVLTGDAHAGEIAEPTEADLSAYHEENADQFMAPETRTAVYLHLDLDEVAADYEPAEEDLRDLYEIRASLYDLPETRSLYQIVFGTEEEASAAKARLDAGEATFDDILGERGEVRADTYLGEVTDGEVPTAAGDAAFALTAAGVAGPVDTGFGFALVDVAAITPAEVVPFEDAREELAVDLRREAALDRAPELAGEMDDLRAGGMQLEEIAAEMGLTLQTAASVAEDGARATGFAADPSFLTELFAAEEGEERDIVETPEGAFFVLRLDEVAPSALRPLDEVRPIVEAGWRAEAVRAALTEKAEALKARVDAGADMGAIAEELGVEVLSEGPKTRLEAWDAIAGREIEALFIDGTGASVVARAPGRVDAVSLARVSEAAPGPETPENEALREQLAQQMNAMAGDDALTLFLTSKQQEVGVSVNQQLIESILVTGHGGY